MKLMVELLNVSSISKIKKIHNVETILVGLADYSFNSAKNYSLDEIKEIKKKIKNIKLALNVERLFTDKILLNFKDFVINNDQLFDYYTYSDFGVYILMKELGLDSKLILRSPTYLTNTSDILAYLQYNKQVVASSEIAANELNDILNHIQQPIYIDLFGMNAIFNSRRELITNYFNYRNEAHDPKKGHYQIKEELRNELMHILEDNTGTHIFEPFYYHLTNEINYDNVRVGIIHVPFMKPSTALSIIDAYNEFIDSSNSDELEKKIKEIIPNAYKGAYDYKSFLLKGGNDCE